MSQKKMNEKQEVLVETSKTAMYEPIHIEEGITKAIFKEFKILGEKTYPDGKTAETGLMIFEVKNKKGEKVELSYYIPDVKATSGNKFGKAIQVLADGQPIDWGQPLNIGMFFGNQVRVLVEDYVKLVDGKEITVSSINKVKPLKE